MILLKYNVNNLSFCFIINWANMTIWFDCDFTLFKSIISTSWFLISWLWRVCRLVLNNIVIYASNMNNIVIIFYLILTLLNYNVFSKKYNLNTYVTLLKNLDVYCYWWLNRQNKFLIFRIFHDHFIDGSRTWEN